MRGKPVLGIVGAGALALQVASVFRKDYQIAGFLDEPRYANEHRNGVSVLGLDSFPLNCAFVLAVGDPKLKSLWHHKHRNLRFATLIHHTAIVGENAQIGEGCIVFPYAVIDPEVHLGKHVFVGYNAFVGHHATVGDYATLCGHSAVSGYTVLEEGAYMGTHSLTVNERYRTHQLRIGRFSVAGAGAIVAHDIPDGEVHVCGRAKRK